MINYYANKKMDLTAMFLRQMAVMVAADIPIEEAVRILSVENEMPRFRRLAKKLDRDIQKGVSLEVALKKHPGIFNDLLVYIISRETDGRKISQALNMYADNIEKHGFIKARLMNSMYLPVVTLFVAFTVLFVVMEFVIPVFKDIYSDFGSRLPAQTRNIIALSEFVDEYLIFILAGLAAIPAILRRKKRVLHILLAHIPGIGGLLKKFAVYQFVRNLSMLLVFGIPVGEASKYAACGVDNTFFARKIDRFMVRVSDVDQLTSEIKHSGFFPGLLVRIMEVGKKSKSLSEVLDIIADYYHKNIDRTVFRFLSAFDVVILVLVATCVGYIVLALYLPIFSLAGAVSG